MVSSRCLKRRVVIHFTKSLRMCSDQKVLDQSNQTISLQCHIHVRIVQMALRACHQIHTTVRPKVIGTPLDFERFHQRMIPNKCIFVR